MNSAKIVVAEGDLLNALEEMSPLEWRRYQRRCAEVQVGKRFELVDQSSRPPFFAFRFESEREDVIDALRNAIDSYRGKTSWSISGRERQGLPGTNWLIQPSRVIEVEAAASNLGLTPDQYFAQYLSDFGPVAYDDLEGLTQHIREAFQRRSKNLQQE